MDPDTGEPYTPPYEWQLIQTARWLGVPPWELARQPFVWQVWAAKCEAADQHAEQQRHNHANSA